MTFKSKLGNVALEEFNDVDVTGLNVGNEGWKGATLGAIGGLFGFGTLTGAVLSNQVEKKKKEVEHLAAEVARVAESNGKKAVSEGKISADDFKKNVKVGAKGIIRGVIYGSLFGPIYTAIKGSELEDLLEEMEQKCKELNRMLEAAQKSGKNGKTGKARVAKESNEDDSGDTDDTDVAAKDDANGDGEPEAGGDTDDAAGAATTSEVGAAGDATADATDPNADAPADTNTDNTATGGEGDDGAAGGDAAAGDATGDAATTDAATDTGADAPAGDGADAATGDADLSGDAGAGDVTGGDTGTGEGDDTALGGDDEPGADGEGDTPADPAAAADADDAAAVNAATGEVDAVGDPADIAPDEAGDVDAEIIVDEMDQVDRIDDNLADADDDVEKLTEATEALEGLVAILDAGVQRGGFDAIGGALVRHNLNTITTNLKVRPMMIPALEDMESPTARIGAASNTKDQVVKFIKRIIDTIKEAFNRVSQWVVETYKRLTNAFVAIERRAQKLAEMVKASKMKEGNLDNKGLATKLTIKGKLVSDLPAELVRISKVANQLNDPKTYKPYLDALELCEQLAKQPEKAEEIRGEISSLLSKWADNLHANADSSHEGGEKQNGDVRNLRTALLNNQELEVVIPASAEQVGTMRSVIVDASESAAGGEIHALSQADALKICQVVAETAKALRESSEANRGGVKEVNAEIAKRKDTMVALMSTKMNDSESAEVIRKVALFVNTFFMSAPKIPAHAINKAMPRNLAVALDYVAASIGGKAGDEGAPAVGNSAPKALPAA